MEIEGYHSVSNITSSRFAPTTSCRRKPLQCVEERAPSFCPTRRQRRLLIRVRAGGRTRCPAALTSYVDQPFQRLRVAELPRCQFRSRDDGRRLRPRSLLHSLALSFLRNERYRRA